MRNNHRLTDLRIMPCGPIDNAITGSPDTFNNMLNNARLYDLAVNACGVGVVVQGSPDTFNNI